MPLQLFRSCGNNKISCLCIDLINYLSYPLYCNLFLLSNRVNPDFSHTYDSYLFVIPADAEIQAPNFDVPVVNVSATSGTTAILPCTISYVGEKVVGIKYIEELT